MNDHLIHSLMHRAFRLRLSVMLRIRRAQLRFGQQLIRLVLTQLPGTRGRSAERREAAQSTVEYALVLLGAAAVALALVAWVTRSDAIGRLFDVVVGRVLTQAG